MSHVIVVLSVKGIFWLTHISSNIIVTLIVEVMLILSTFFSVVFKMKELILAFALSLHGYPLIGYYLKILLFIQFSFVRF